MRQRTVGHGGDGYKGEVNEKPYCRLDRERDLRGGTALHRVAQGNEAVRRMDAAMSATTLEWGVASRAHPREIALDDKSAKLAERYWQTLQEYLADGSEAALSHGYELARQALLDDYGVLEMAEIHALSLRRLWATARPEDRLLRAAGDFFAQCLSPYEMSHRGAQEGARALRHLNDVLEGELRRVAHVLHDEAGQLLALVHIAVADVATALPPKARVRCEKVQGLLAQVETELRNLSHEWRPTVLDNLGLLPALKFLAERVAKRSRINVSVIGETDTRLPPAVETALYRIVQEALNNAVKHAAARSIRIELQCGPHDVTCSVCDDGKGFDTMQQPEAEAFGLIGMRERVNALGGSLRIITAPLNGTTIQADIPLGDGHAVTFG
ncbi:MAG: ATP-binding protein [Woeseia sp.]